MGKLPHIMKQKDMREFFYVIDCIGCGAWWCEPGATYNGRKESEDALALTLAVGSILEENGVDVYYTRTTDIYESPYQKAQEGNEVGGDLFCLDPSQFQSLSEPVQWSGEFSLQPLWSGSQDGVQHQCRTGAGGVRKSGSE